MTLVAQSHKVGVPTRGTVIHTLEQSTARLEDAGCESPRVDAERQPPKSPLAEDVRERLAEGAPAHEAFELRLLRAAEPPASIREDARARRSEDMSKQELGVHSRCLAPRIREPS